MGIVTDTYVALRDEGAPLDDNRFVALVARLLDGSAANADPDADVDPDDADPDDGDPRWLVPPFAVLTGPAVRSFSPWHMSRGRLHATKEPVPDVAWSGKEPAELLAAVRREVARPGAEVCVWFQSLEHENPDIWMALDHDAGGECAGAVYLLAAPKQVTIINAYVEPDDEPDEEGDADAPPDSCATRLYFRLFGKSAPDAETLLETALGEVLLEALGPDAWSGTSLT